MLTKTIMKHSKTPMDTNGTSGYYRYIWYLYCGTPIYESILKQLRPYNDIF